MQSIREALAAGDPRSLGDVDLVVEWVLGDEKRLAALFECVFDDDKTVRWRAADGLEKVSRLHPEWLAPYATRLLHDVAAIDQHTVQWHLAQIICQIPLTAEQWDQAIALLMFNLEHYADAFVILHTLEALAAFARHDDELAARLIPMLHDFASSDKVSVAKRAAKLLETFPPN